MAITRMLITVLSRIVARRFVMHTFVLYLITCAHVRYHVRNACITSHISVFLSCVWYRCHAYDFYSIEKRQMRKKSVDYREKKGRGTSRWRIHSACPHMCTLTISFYVLYTSTSFDLTYTRCRALARAIVLLTVGYVACTISQDTISTHTHINIFNLMTQTCHFMQRALF